MKACRKWEVKQTDREASCKWETGGEIKYVLNERRVKVMCTLQNIRSPDQTAVITKCVVMWYVTCVWHDLT